MSTETTKTYEIAVRTTEKKNDGPGGVSQRIHYVSLAELMDLLDDEQARQIKETMKGVGDGE